MSDATGPGAVLLEADHVSHAFTLPGGGSYHFVENFPARYIADLTKRPKLKRKLKVVCACGNGTAGAFAPQVLAVLVPALLLLVAWLRAWQPGGYEWLRGVAVVAVVGVAALAIPREWVLRRARQPRD